MKRIFYAMMIIKNRLRNSIWDNWLNTCLITYVHKDILKEDENETIYYAMFSIYEASARVIVIKIVIDFDLSI